MNEDEIIELLENRLKNYECDGQMSIFDMYPDEINQNGRFNEENDEKSRKIAKNGE